jgi:hypothetical protein
LPAANGYPEIHGIKKKLLTWLVGVFLENVWRYE